MRTGNQTNSSKPLRILILLAMLAIILIGAILTVPETTKISASEASRPLPEVYYVSSDGENATGDGTADAPWKTINYALQVVPDGALLLVKPGLYQEQINVERQFRDGIVLRSEVAYAAQLRHNGRVISCFVCSGVTIEGFDIAHSPNLPANRYVIQIQDQDRSGLGGQNFTLRNNIIHDSYNNDLVKINNGARQILVEHNLFYNQSGQDSHIDITSSESITVRHNIFLNDFSSSGRPDQQNTGSLIVVKDANGDADQIIGSNAITIDSNIFLNWSGGTGNAYVALGDASRVDYYHAYDVLIQNNLMLGNSPHHIHAPLKAFTVRDVVFRHNTVWGNLPASAFAIRLDSAGPSNTGIQLANNAWIDPQGTMGSDDGQPGRLFRIDKTQNIALNSNLYWNGGRAIPFRPNDNLNYGDDQRAIITDPGYGHVPELRIPTWDPAARRFRDGSLTIKDVFANIFAQTGLLYSNGATVNAADPLMAPETDILGRPRLQPDIGAIEYVDPSNEQ